MYPQADFLIRRWAEQVHDDPTLVAQQRWKAVAEGARGWLASAVDHVPELLKGVTGAYDGIATTDFERAVREFFDTAIHPTLAVPHTDRVSPEARADRPPDYQRLHGVFPLGRW